MHPIIRTAELSDEITAANTRIRAAEVAAAAAHGHWTPAYVEACDAAVAAELAALTAAGAVVERSRDWYPAVRASRWYATHHQAPNHLATGRVTERTAQYQVFGPVTWRVISAHGVTFHGRWRDRQDAEQFRRSLGEGDRSRLESCEPYCYGAIGRVELADVQLLGVEAPVASIAA